MKTGRFCRLAGGGADIKDMHMTILIGDSMGNKFCLKHFLKSIIVFKFFKKINFGCFKKSAQKNLKKVTLENAKLTFVVPGGRVIGDKKVSKNES